MMLTIVDHHVPETARALDQKQRLEEKINELNSQTGSPLSQKETTNKKSSR